MLVVIVCVVLLVAGVVLAIVWGGEELREPASAPPASGLTHPDGLRLYAWWASVFTVAGTATGLLVTGAGGRLVMRLLAIASPEVRGQLTEAQALVGYITVQGSIAYLVFGALPAAFASAALYLVVAPWLPRGRFAGPTFGAVLLVTLSAFEDPLRAENIDFDYVGPGWLSVLGFSVLAILQGTLLAAIAGRLSRSLPLVTRKNWPGTAASLVPAVVLFPVGVVLALGGLVTFAFPRLLPWALAVRSSRRGILIGRVVLAVAVLAALPFFITSVVSIWTR